MTRIPLVDLAWQHREIRAEIEPAFASVMERGAFILGPEVAALSEVPTQPAAVNAASMIPTLGNRLRSNILNILPVRSPEIGLISRGLAKDYELR